MGISRTRPTVSIVVVTTNTPATTERCINSILRNTTAPYELTVVNNSSSRAIRGSLKKFRGIQIIRNPRNLGYTKAANQGARQSKGSYLCFLNSDTWVPPQWTERLLEAVRLPGVGAVSPLGEWERYRYRSWPSIKNKIALETFNLLTDEAFRKWRAGRTKNARWLSGFCLMTPRTVLTRLGFFDERFFFGWEDIDYCLRLRLQGYRLLKVESLFVYHQQGASSSTGKHRRLAKQAEKLFLSKWSSLLNIKARRYQTVFSEIQRRKTGRYP